MQTATFTLRLPVRVIRQITATAKRQKKTPRQWAAETLAHAAAPDETVDWESHWEWMRQHGRPGIGDADEVIRLRR